MPLEMCILKLHYFRKNSQIWENAMKVIPKKLFVMKIKIVVEDVVNFFFSFFIHCES